MADLPPARFFPAAPSLSGARRNVRCAVCKETVPLALGETFVQRAPAKNLGDRRACSCGRLQITGAPGWEAIETTRRRLGV